MDIEGKAFKLEPGGTYIIESDTGLSDSQLESLAAQSKALHKKTGITFIYLSPGLRVVREHGPVAVKGASGEVWI